MRLENGRIIPGEPATFKQKTQCLDASTGGHLEMEWASVDAIDSDGTLYVGSGDKKIYALKSDFKGPAKSP